MASRYSFIYPVTDHPKGVLMKKAVAFVLVALMALSMFPNALQLTHAQNRLLEERAAPAASTQGTFALVSYFDNGGSYGDYGWQLMSGQSPSISSAKSYFGEPSMKVPSGTVAVNTEGVVPGGQFISFQAAISSAGAISLFSIVNSEGASVFTVGVQGLTVYAGTSAADLQMAGNAPASSAYPASWVYVSANVFNTSTNKQFSWTAQLFIDGSSSYFYNLSVPGAFQYAGISVSGPSVQGRSGYFTDIVFSSYEIPILIPGYNPMEGYGQGSGLLVNLLQPFTILTGQIQLNNWNTPEVGILSYQINAMNYYGTTTSTCKGFFQLGVDLNPNGFISPWYVAGTNCFAHYFLPSNNPAVQPGFYSPPGTRLILSIVDSPASKTISYQIIDLSVPASSGDRYWNATIAYSGTEFYSTYTQLEFQPSSAYPISNYYFNGSMSGLSYGSSPSTLLPLNESYMLPYTLNAPPTWSFTYYSDQTSGYAQIA